MPWSKMFYFDLENAGFRFTMHVMLLSQHIDSENRTFPLALVTGAAHRLGKVFAMSLARQGFGIALHYHRSQEMALAAAVEIQALGVPVFLFQADLRKKEQIQGLFDRLDDLIKKTEFSLAPLKVLVNSAAIMEHADVSTLSLEDFDETIGLNLRAPFLCSQLAYRRMESGGLIVNITDIAAHKTWQGYPAYTVSKAGLEALTRVLARSFAPRVRVNAIAPGLVLPAEEFDRERWAHLVKRVPARRAASTHELGNTLEFLIKNEYITGQTIVVDGGYSLL